MTSRVVEPLASVGRLTSDIAATIGRGGFAAIRAFGALRGVDVWGRLLLPQMGRIGVDSVPIALFIAMFTGIVMALQPRIPSRGPSRSTSSVLWWARR